MKGSKGRRAAMRFQPHKRRLVIGIILRVVAMLAVCAIASSAEIPQPSEYQVKAAFLYNFAKFVEWPANALQDSSATITLCVLGEDPFGIDLEHTIKGKIVNGRELVIQRFKGLHGLGGCHILFISSSEMEGLAQILETLHGRSTLTVGEMERFAKLGGMINFTLEGNKVRFEINVDAAERAGLKISSQLLKLAKIIRDGDKK